MNNNRKFAVRIQRPARRRGPILLGALCALSAAGAESAFADTWPTQGWQTATPAEAGMDQALLEQARDHALTGGGAGIITRSGKRVFSWGDQAQKFGIKSTTKSIGVTVLGLALQDGLVNLSDAAQTHLPSVGVPPQANEDTGWLDDITILHLATHSAGFEKPGGFIDLFFEPGTAWSYSDGGANWLADMLTVRYGMDLKTLMFDRVFEPLGIQPVDLTWRNNLHRDDTINGIKRREFGSGMRADVDAMARIGYLYLRRGAWESGRIVPGDFVLEASRPAPSLAGLPVTGPGNHPGATGHYGLLWWNNGDGSLANVPADAFWSWGLSDSFIIVIPSLDVVAARVGSGWRSGWDSDYAVIQPFIEPIAQSVIGVTISQAPIVSIDAPADGTSSESASPVAFSGSAIDAEDGTLTSGLVWSSDLDGMIGTGGSFSTSALSAGTHLITASVSDSGGLVGAANVFVTIEPPAGSMLTLPDIADTFSRKFAPDATSGTKTFMRVHGPNEKQLSFVRFDVSGLSGTVSAATLKLYVQDVPDSGVVDAHAVQGIWNELQLTHNNRPPYSATPVDSVALTPGDEGGFVSFDVTSLVQQWADSPATAFGVALTSQNLHALFETREATHAPVIEVTLGDGNASPVVVIDSPADNASFSQGEPVTFTGTATDAEEGSLTGSLEWTSDRDGALGSGGSVSVSTLSVGVHIVTASVVDGAGAHGSDSIQLTVNPAGGGSMLTLADIADTFSRKFAPDVNSGNKNFIRVHGPNEKQVGFIRFDVSGLSGTVSSAAVKLYVSKILNSGAVDIHAIQADWSESDLTHNNKPPYDVTLASLTLSPTDVGTVVSLDITSLVQQWADSPTTAFGIALTSQNADAQFHTREAANSPVIEVQLN